MDEIKFIDLFSGIGGFRRGLELSGGYRCVWSNDWDKYANKIYTARLGEANHHPGDVRGVDPRDIPDFDLLCAGFPCQSFSVAGKRKGFKDTRGTLFFEVCRIAKSKRPPLLLLENVGGLLSHDKGLTFQIILESLEELGYWVEWQVLNSKYFGVPQNRQRVFIIGHRMDNNIFKPIFPIAHEEFPSVHYQERVESTRRIERVYLLSQEFTEDLRILSTRLQKTERQTLFPTEMSRLLEKIEQDIQRGESREIEREPQEIRQKPEENIPETITLDAWEQSDDNSEGVYRVVQIPTEEVLLLWNNGGGTSISFRCLQQQNPPFDCGQNRFIQRLRKGKLGSCLLTMQSYQGRLIFSIGDGRDWTKIYSTKMEGANYPNLSSILEEKVDEKYFLSEKQMSWLKEKMKEKKNRLALRLIETTGREQTNTGREQS